MSNVLRLPGSATGTYLRERDRMWLDTPVRVLILGGNWSLGRLVAQECLRREFATTVFNRGRSTSPPPAGVQHIRGDRKNADDLRALVQSGPSWDVVVDISGKVPAVVGRAAQALADTAERYISISTYLVYRDWPDLPLDESFPPRECDPDFDPGDWTFERDLYGKMKAGCERACRQAFGDDRTLILRVHEIIGQQEDTGPLLWWLHRMRCGGPVLVPAPDRSIQPVDARDVARFTIDLAQRGTCGVFNVAAPPDRTFGDLLRACAEVATGGHPELVWIDEPWLKEQGASEYLKLPLWGTAAASPEMKVQRAMAAGLTCLPFSETAADIWRWHAASGARYEPAPKSGISAVREAELIARWRARTSTN